MLVSYNWLNEYVNLNEVSAEKVAELLTKHGIEVEGIEEKGDDKILELSLTPNRSDCLSMLGVAYEMGAILGKPIILPAFINNDDKKNINMVVQDTHIADYYGLASLSEIEVEQSPTWIQESLENAGIRPINNVVDTTNYVMLEYGQPLHAFDADKISGKVVVRLAKEGERVVTIDEKERKLTATDIVIADEEKIIGIAGVMGAKNSEVDENTKRVLLEFAIFDPSSVRKTSKRLDLRSEASLRFEKGLDQKAVYQAGMRAIDLLEDVAKGELTGTHYIDNRKNAQRLISISLDTIIRTLGFSVSIEKTKDILDRLNFYYTEDNDVFTITPPSRRRDIELEADIIEEIARMYGYDNIPNTLPDVTAKESGLTSYQKKRRRIKRLLSDLGLHQAITYSLTKKENASSSLSLLYPISEERSVLRSSLIPHLLEAIDYNKNRKEENVFLYEVGNVFSGMEQKEMLAAALSGNYGTKKMDFFVAKGILDRMWSELGMMNEIAYQKAEKEGMHPGRTASVLFKDQIIGFIGQIHPSLKEETYVFEIEIKTVLEKEKERRFESLGKHPVVSRDLSIVLDRKIPAGKIISVIKDLDLDMLKETQIIDLYEGEKMEKDKKSITISIKYENKEKTLTDEEIHFYQEKVITELEKELSVSIRK